MCGEHSSRNLWISTLIAPCRRSVTAAKPINLVETSPEYRSEHVRHVALVRVEPKDNAAQVDIEWTYVILAVFSIVDGRRQERGVPRF